MWHSNEIRVLLLLLLINFFAIIFVCLHDSLIVLEMLILFDLLLYYCHAHCNVNNFFENNIGEAFMCRFLRLLSEYDWNFSALIVDINDELTAEDEKEINVSATNISS